MSERAMTASDVWAMSQGTKNEGDLECHWCLAPCSRQFLHDDLPQVPFQRSKSTAKRPSSPYQCLGCWLWHRKRVTVSFLTRNGNNHYPYKDRQCALDHAWWITPTAALAVREEDKGTLWNLLLDPPKTFVLMLRTSEWEGETLLQLASVNDLHEAKADTQIQFTINNIPHYYTVYCLEETQSNPGSAHEPGMQALIRILGSPPRKEKPDTSKGGRPSITPVASPKRDLKAK